MARTLRLKCQHWAVFLALPLAPFWLLFAVVNYPLIVIADSDFGLAASLEQVAKVGAGMTLLSLVSLLWAAGVFGRSAGRWGCASVLLGAITLAGLFLYPLANVSVLSEMAIMAHLVGIAVVFLGRAGLTLRDDELSAAPDASHS